MKLSRDISGTELARALKKLGYQTTRQTGSHLRLTTNEHGQHHVTIPNRILADVTSHFQISRDRQHLSKPHSLPVF